MDEIEKTVRTGKLLRDALIRDAALSEAWSLCKDIVVAMETDRKYRVAHGANACARAIAKLRDGDPEPEA